MAVAVETSFQNVGIASGVALTMFHGKEAATAVGVPLWYGVVEALLVGVYCVLCWKMGWSLAPHDENVVVVIMGDYQVLAPFLPSSVLSLYCPSPATVPCCLLH